MSFSIHVYSKSGDRQAGRQAGWKAGNQGDGEGGRERERESGREEKCKVSEGKERVGGREVDRGI